MFRVTQLSGFGTLQEESAGGTDVIPDALNWGTLTGANVDTVTVEGTNQTVTGIDTTVTMDVAALSAPTDCSYAELFVSKNDGAYATLSTWNGSSWQDTGSRQWTVVNNDTVKFKASILNAGGLDGTWTQTITVRNVSNSNATLDTFLVDLTSQTI